MKFEDYAAEGNKFLKELAHELGGNVNDTDHAYRVMKSVFQTVRDILTPEESLHMIAQLPLVIKGVYVDGWQLHEIKRIRSMAEFLQSLRAKNERAAGRDFGNDQTAIQHTKCVLNLLKRHVTTGEIQHIIDQFPMELAGLWLSEEKMAHH